MVNIDFEERISTLEKIVNGLLEKDKEIDRFCKEILDALKEMDRIINLSNQAQMSYAEVVRGIVETIKTMQSN